MAFAKKKEEAVVIKPANIVQTTLTIRGTSPLVIHRFSSETKAGLMEGMATPEGQKKTKKDRKPREYEKEFNGARHLSTEGWDGISAPAFRNAMIAACRTCGIVMTRAKMSVFIVQDGVSKDDGTPLVRIHSKNGPEMHSASVRNSDGSVDIRVRPMWREWWANITLRFDLDMITANSVVNLLNRAGQQVGVGEGRPFSTNSCGMGWGTFEVEVPEEKAAE